MEKRLKSGLIENRQKSGPMEKKLNSQIRAHGKEKIRADGKILKSGLMEKRLKSGLIKNRQKSGFMEKKHKGPLTVGRPNFGL